MLLRKRLRTRLSIPLGLRQDGSRRLKRSCWWRSKRLVPVQRSVSIGALRVDTIVPSADPLNACCA